MAELTKEREEEQIMMEEIDKSEASTVYIDLGTDGTAKNESLLEELSDEEKDSADVKRRVE